MTSNLSRFETRLALWVSGGTLLTLGIRNRLTPVSGFVLFVLGGLLLRAGARRLRPGKSSSESDPVNESSNESFPASDAPAWVYGGR